MNGFEDFMNNPMAMMGLGILGGNYGRNSRAAFSNSIQGGLGAYAMAQRQAALKKKQEREDAKFKLEQNQYDRMKAAADLYRSKNPSLGGVPDEAVIEIMQKEHTPTALKKNMGMYANNPELIRKAASNFGMTPAQLMRINSGVPDPTSPGKPGEPIKAEDQANWVDPKTGQSLAEYNRSNPNNYVGNAEQAYTLGYMPHTTQQLKSSGAARTSGTQIGAYGKDLDKWYDMTRDKGLWDKGVANWDAFFKNNTEAGNQLALIKSKHKSLAVNLSRAMGEVGNLNQQDVQMWVDRLAKPYTDQYGFGDNEQLAKMKMTGLKNDLEAIGISVNWDAPEDKTFIVRSPGEQWSDNDFVYKLEILENGERAVFRKKKAK